MNRYQATFPPSTERKEKKQATELGPALPRDSQSAARLEAHRNAKVAKVEREQLSKREAKRKHESRDSFGRELENDLGSWLAGVPRLYVPVPLRSFFEERSSGERLPAADKHSRSKLSSRTGSRARFRRGSRDRRTRIAKKTGNARGDQAPVIVN